MVEEIAKRKEPAGGRVLRIVSQGDYTMTEYDLIIISFVLTLVAALVKSIAATSHGKGSGFVQKLSFKTKVRFVIVVNQLMNECRMYDKKPREISAQCYLCAARGRWFRCPRSKELRKTI